MALAGMVGAVYVTDPTAALQAFSQAATECTDGEYRRYAVSDPAHRYWPLDPAEAGLEVYVGEVKVTSGYTADPAGGSIIFDTPQDAAAVVTVTGKAVTLMQAGGMFDWSLDLDGEDVDAATFASGGWKEFVRTLKGWSGSAEAYWGDEYFYEQLGKPVIVKLFVDAGESQRHVAGYAIITGDGIEAPVDGLVQESVDFTGTGPLTIDL